MARMEDIPKAVFFSKLQEESMIMVLQESITTV